MDAFMEQFKDLTKIPMEEILKATNNFHKENFIGGGGFGKVYKGILSRFKEQSMVAFKRLDRQSGQGEAEFVQEIMMLSFYRHKYLISLLGFCKEGDDMILVYEHAANGSLDAHLKSADLTWTQRLKICLQAAKGLRYLHDPNGTSQRLIHRDIKSANILLDDKWNAKIADFGLSKIGPANQKYSFLFENPAGTIGYCDPLYITTKTLTKEADVYSFGVVLFEVLCGKLCFTYDINGVYKVFVNEWIDRYEKKNLKGIIFEGMIKQKLDSSSLKLFSDIAYQCLKESREERPKMDDVVEQLEIALGLQDYEETLTDVVPPDVSEEDHRNVRLSKGILIDEGKTWFWVDKKKKHCEMISVLECLVPIPSESADYKSRFAGGFYEASKLIFKTHVRTKFLSPLTIYTVNLIFKDKKPKERYIGLEYSLEGGKKCYSFLSDVREDGWFTAELFQFKSDQRTLDLQILFYLKYCPTLLIEGIEFRPMEEVEHAVLKDDNVDTQESATYWNNNKPSSLTDGKKGLMLPTRASLKEDKCRLEFLTETRFEEVASNPSLKYEITCEFETRNLSPDSTYATFLIYKQESKNPQPRPAQVKDANLHSGDPFHIYLCTPQTPVIKKSADKQMYSPSHRPKMKGLPKLRNDGWMEVQIWEFQTYADTAKIVIHYELSSYDKSALKEVKARGIEFRVI